ncbi:hypothetical protein GQ55_2G052900 [Panicum hallii var. hallii]|uniref:Protein kinase domain-containing protein n=1 Tax=Panicum hallii var. hallii TaxID=1504633 RepID=A0A2T7ELR2_9POAL|nr:hypothetical protein GQ55_2G052900 [Panicum hallii var. hallii]
MTTPSQPQLLLLILALLAAAAAGALLIQAAAIAEQHELPITRPDCPDKCGNISIPFPFGMTPGCFREGFQVTCDHSFQPPRAFLAAKDGGRSARIWTLYSFFSASKKGNYSIQYPENNLRVKPIELIDVSIAKSEARVYGAVASACSRNATAGILKMTITTLLARGMDEAQGPFLMSLARNVLIGVGLESAPSVSRFHFNTSPGDGEADYLVSCSSSVLGNLQLPSNGSCSGHGCCQASLPEGRRLTGVSVATPPNTLNNTMWRTSPCTFAMLVEHPWYNFSAADLYGDTTDKFPRGVPFVIDFAIRNGKCPAEGQQPPLDYACVSGNSSCADVTNGYVCKCSEHYEGNPYISNGCQDIDECKFPGLYPCSSDGICKNRLLGYDCPCKPGMKGDGKTGTCQPIFSRVAKIVVGVIGGFVVIVALLFLILLHNEKSKMREFYEKNGGPILEKAKIIKLFKKAELKEILKSKNLIGKGFFGEVYKGLLDNKLVAVKKPISGAAQENNEQFVNEIIIQSQVIHKNIVRLIGCCLEVDIPMLVYEFLPKGNLEDILHSNKNVVPLNMDVRLSIAAQSADGLAYMHSKTTNKILHGDVKPANILLDDNFMPKISDFGISRLIARDKQHTDEVIGDMSYMDPVYRQTGLLTEKSDVYSFGVVILELISRKKASYSDNNSLVRNFFEAHKEKRVAELFDSEIALTSNLELLHSLARIAVECLNIDVDQRPSMIEVAQSLILLNRSSNL